MDSQVYTYSSSADACYDVVRILVELFASGKILGTNVSADNITQLRLSCEALDEKNNSDRFSEPMVWIGIYIAIASLFCTLAMAADLFHGFQSKKFWFPCKYFSLNAASITVITVALKLPVDLSSAMPRYMDQETKVGSLVFMCTMMANLTPSLASMDNKTLLENIVGLSILVIAVIVNILIQINTSLIARTPLDFGTYTDYVNLDMFAYIYAALILLLLIIMISSSLTIPTSKGILEAKYQAINKVYLTDESVQHIQMSRVEKLRQHVRRFWVMAETGSPQFVMARNPLSTASGVICVILLLLKVIKLFNIVNHTDFLYQSPYKWSTIAIFITQSIGVLVGSIAPIFRCFSVFNFKLVTKWNRKHFMFFKVEKYWLQKLHEWKQSPISFLSTGPRSRSIIYNLKNNILNLCIGFQVVIVVLCKLAWLIAIIVPLFVVSCLYWWRSWKARWFTPSIASSTDDINEDVSDYVLQINNEMELAEKTLKRISMSMSSFILKASKEENKNLLELLGKSTGFKGVEIFDSDDVQSLLPIELVNNWSLPIVTLTCISVSLPNIPKDTIGSLFESVGEGLSYTRLVEESLNCASEYVNLRKVSMALWHEVENNHRWLGIPLAKEVFKRKTTTEILEWFSDKAEKLVTEFTGYTDGELVDTSKILIAANSMYRITQTILLRSQSNIEPITKKQLFSHLNCMIADILCACFTNLPRVIRMRCHENVIEKREASVKVAATLLGKTTKIIERLETREVPSMDDEKLAHIEEWHRYMKQSIP